MTPAARIAAEIELHSAVFSTPRPADATVSDWFRARRYIGSKDRAAIAEGLFGLLRRHARLGWWLAKFGAPDTARTRIIADLVLARGRTSEATLALFSGGRYAPVEPDPAERRLALALGTRTLEHPDMPDAVRLEVPDWAESGLRDSLGPQFEAELTVQREPAPVDLRVNPIRGDRAAAAAALMRDGVETTPTRLSPWGLRVRGRAAVAQTQAFRDGLVEIQDEGSQLVALLLGARPGHQVVDFCAGAGGKTLAIAAAMGNRGHIIATDVLERRLERAALRLRRAGLHNVETRPLSGARDPWVKRHKGKFDRVLVDAPCTGTGTWRRNPDARWRPLGPGLSELLPLQADILASAARLVKPGGRLVYATCSLMTAENAAQIDRFLDQSPQFRRIPFPQAWADAVQPLGAGSVPMSGPDLTLLASRDQTDGFYAAVLERVPDPDNGARASEAEAA